MADPTSQTDVKIDRAISTHRSLAAVAHLLGRSAARELVSPKPASEVSMPQTNQDRGVAK